MAKRRVKDFPVEYFDMWSLAAKGMLRLEFDTKGRAINKKQDMHKFRRQLREEAPELAEEYANVDLEVLEEGGKGILTFYVPEWKRQVRRQMENLKKPEEEILFTPLPDPTPAVVPPSPVDHVSSTLEDLGFSSESEDKQ